MTIIAGILAGYALPLILTGIGTLFFIAWKVSHNYDSVPHAGRQALIIGAVILWILAAVFAIRVHLGT